jgi:ribonuclease J
VEYEKVSHVHVSGHASSDELRDLIRRVRPLYFIPVHGEYRHLLRHADLAVEEGIPRERVLVLEDGDVVELSKEWAGVTQRIEVKRVFVDGTGVGDVGTEVLRDRRALSEVGLVIVVIPVSDDTGELLSGPEVLSRGVTYQEMEPDLIEGARRAVEELLVEVNPRSPEQWEEARESIRLAVRRHINRLLGRKPLVQTVFIRI